MTAAITAEASGRLSASPPCADQPVPGESTGGRNPAQRVRPASPPVTARSEFAADSSLEGDGFDLSVLSAYRRTPGFQPFFGEGTKGVLSRVLSQKEGTKNPGWCEFCGVKRARSGGRRSIRTAPTPYLRNTLLPDGSPAVKEDVERYLLGHAGTDVHAGYGKQWIETLKAAIEVIPDPL